MQAHNSTVSTIYSRHYRIESAINSQPEKRPCPVEEAAIQFKNPGLHLASTGYGVLCTSIAILFSGGEYRKLAMPDKPDNVTDLLNAHSAGSERALDELVENVYDELHELAHIQLKRLSPSRTLNTTALVHELYCKLVDSGVHHWKDRNHFYAACATTMRHLLVDNARRRLRDKRGGGQRAVTLEESASASEGDAEWLIELDRLINRLGEQNARLVAVFECRYFGGFSNSETASILSLSERTIERDWAHSRSWLKQALADVSRDKDPRTSGKEFRDE